MKRIGRPPLNAFRAAMLGMIGGGNEHRAELRPMNGVRPAQQELYDMIGQARPILYGVVMWQSLKGHSPYADLDLTNDRITRWAPLNQSLYTGYKMMLAGLLMMAKGDRIALHNSVETRYPFLDDDVIQFCSQIAPEYKLNGKIEKWILRQVAAKTLPPQIANRPKTMFRSTRSQTFLGEHRPGWVDQLLSPESLKATGYFSPKHVAREVWWQRNTPTASLRRFVLDMGLTTVVSTQLWHHLFCGGGLCDLPTWSAPEFAGNRLPSSHYQTRDDVPEEVPLAAV
jgi:asparagine synthase (glutamine-hydrolysing)